MSTEERADHWGAVYLQKDAQQASWFQAVPELSVRLIQDLLPDRSGRIIDVGAGASTLVDHLLADGYSSITVLDVASPAMEIVSQRLGSLISEVDLVTADLLEYEAPELFDLWHDRAVLHFLREEDQQRRYAEVMASSIRAGGHAVIATFSVGGPQRCSGLDIVQYDAAGIVDLVGHQFQLLGMQEETHLTPAGKPQLFTYFMLWRVPEASNERQAPPCVVSPGFGAG